MQRVRDAIAICRNRNDPRSAIRWASSPRAILGKLAFGLCGLTLVAAAGLKLFGQNVSPFAQYGWLLSPTAQSLAVVWELILGGWLLYRVVQTETSTPAPWVAAVLTFLTFAVVSGYLGIIGQASCGCFGVIKASPLAAFVVDVTALAVLAIAWPKWSDAKADVPALKWVGGMAVALGVAVGFCTLTFGSAESALAKLRGDSLEVKPVVIDFGEGTPGETVVQTVVVKNYTDTPFKLIGGTSDCSCLATQDMPIAIPANGQAEIRIALKVPASQPGQLNRVVELLTDCHQQPKVGLKAVCRIGN